MKFGPLGDEVFRRTYARTKSDGSQETWAETAQRVAAGNGYLAGLLEDSYETLLVNRDINEMRVVPAGRHLWASGAASGLGLFNCHRAGWGPGFADHFTFTFDQLMLGGGVGANYSSEYLDTLPSITQDLQVSFWIDPAHPDAAAVEEAVGRAPRIPTATYYVHDSREGWVAALEFLLETATLPRVGQARSVDRISFDLSGVRAYGQPIKGFGGTASGPAPLARMLALVADLLRHRKRLDPMTAMSVDHAIASCVVAGNVRRSARMSILHWADPAIKDFLNCKQNPAEHWTTNISVEVDQDFWEWCEVGHPSALSILFAVAEGMLRDGEPGLYNSALASEGERGDVRSTNPCGEIALEEWEQCCLGHVNLAHPDHADPAVLDESFARMARFLVRATLAPASDQRQEEVKNRNRRIGVGFFGFQEWLAREGVLFSGAGWDSFVAGELTRWRQVVRAAADAEAERLGVASPIKVTTVAPTGSIAKLPGTTEGLHPVYAKHFVRRVRYADNDPELARLVATGHEVEACQYNPDTTVVKFYVHDLAAQHYGDELIESVDEVDLDEMLAVQAAVQRHYADNAVSFTANVSPGRYFPDDLVEVLLQYGPSLKGTTIFPDLSRPQSPLERIDEATYQAARVHDLGQSIDDECASGACPVR